MKKPIVLAVGLDSYYLKSIEEWLAPFAERIFLSANYIGAARIATDNKVDIFILDGFGKEMSMALQQKFAGAMVCLLTADEYMTCTDSRVHCIQRPKYKRNFVSCIMNKWRQRNIEQKRSSLIEHHLGLVNVYKTDPQPSVEVLHMRLKRNFFATLEAVALRHSDHPNRTNFCITLQRGCPGGCIMCSTAKIDSHTTNLTAHEIAAQVAYLFMTYTAFNSDQIVIAAHGGGDPRFCLNEYCNAVKVIEQTYIKSYKIELDHKLSSRYIATSIGGEKTWNTLFSRLEDYDMSYEISAISTNKQKRDFVLPATRFDLPLANQVEMLADNAAKHNRLYKYRHLLTNGFNDSQQEAKEIAKLVLGTPHRVIIQKMETGCLKQFPNEVTDQKVEDFMDMLRQEGVDVCYNKNVGEGPVKCGMHITPQDRSVLIR